ncbi:MAG: hypothetical protein ACK55Z_07975, partial [bacterium]
SFTYHLGHIYISPHSHSYPLTRNREEIPTSAHLKDIVQPKKRGVKRGMNRFVSTSYTIADVFFEHLKS